MCTLYTEIHPKRRGGDFPVVDFPQVKLPCTQIRSENRGYCLTLYVSGRENKYITCTYFLFFYEESPKSERVLHLLFCTLHVQSLVYPLQARILIISFFTSRKPENRGYCISYKLKARKQRILPLLQTESQDTEDTGFLTHHNPGTKDTAFLTHRKPGTKDAGFLNYHKPEAEVLRKLSLSGLAKLSRLRYS